MSAAEASRALLRARGRCPACHAPLVDAPGGFACARACATYLDDSGRPDLRPRRALTTSVRVTIDPDDPLFGAQPRFLDAPVLAEGPLVDVVDLVPAAGGGAPALEIGSGGLPLHDVLAARGFSPHTLDVEAKGASLQGDVHALPFVDDTFALVVASAVLEHVRVPHLAVQEVARVLEPGGRFVGAVAFLQPFHRSYFHVTHAGLLELFEAAGLRATVVRPGGAPPFRGLMRDAVEQPALGRVGRWSATLPDVLVGTLFKARRALGRRRYDPRFDLAGAVYFAAVKGGPG